MKKTNPDLIFLLLWLLLHTLLGQWHFINHPPEGMHQGGQTDRASVAWNYYHESMNFFEPRVMENRAADGVAGMEFPIINYTVAICYKLFGPSEIWYRLIMFLIVSAGVFAAWKITGFFSKSTIQRYATVYGWYLSPVLVYYSANFVPDPAAMSFSLIAWYYFFRFYFNLNSRKSITLYTVFITLSGLIKITFLISHVAVAALFLLYRTIPKLFPQGFPSLKRAWLWFLLPLIPVGGWYYYSGWLTAKTGNVHFLQQVNPARSIAEFADNTKYGFNTWQDSFYAPELIYFILSILLLTAIFKYRQATIPATIFILLLLGFALDFVLFNRQFRYHDYYYILMFPALFFGLIAFQQIYLEQRVVYSGITSIALALAFFYLPFSGFSHCKKMLEERYHEGGYFCQEVFAGIRQYPAFSKEVQHLIPERAEVVSVFDPSPNTTLYFLKHKGIRIAHDFSPELTRQVMENSKADYMILNDSLVWEHQYEPVLKTNKKLLYRKGMLSLWKWR